MAVELLELFFFLGRWKPSKCVGMSALVVTLGASSCGTVIMGVVSRQGVSYRSD